MIESLQLKHQPPARFVIQFAYRVVEERCRWPKPRRKRHGVLEPPPGCGRRLTFQMTGLFQLPVWMVKTSSLNPHVV